MRRLHERLPTTFTAQALLYPLFLLLSLIFAQLLRRPVSHMLFVFVLLLPTASILWLIAARICISTALRATGTTVSKHATVRLYASVSNRYQLPFAFVTGSMSLPIRRGMRCEA